MTRSVRLPLAVLAVLALLGLAAPAAAAGMPAQPTWHADQARVPDARAPGRGGEGVLVAVLDTWVDAAHRDFEGRVVPGADCTGGACREGATGPDACDHGTHVAGTVAASSYGVAPRARVLPVKVLSHDTSSSPPACSGTVSSVAAGIRYATARGARVINLSLGALVPGLSSSSAIAGAVSDASRAGVVVVFAAGNSSVPVADSYGGEALIVAATGPNGQLAGYSQRGAGVSLAAPGGDPGLSDCAPASCVISLFPGDRYAVAAGTSMAAPHVAGIAALLLGQDPARGREQVIERLRGTARPLLGAGSGLVDAAAALSSAPARPQGQPPAQPSQPQPPAGTAPAPVPAPVDPVPLEQPVVAPSPAGSPAGTGTAQVPVTVPPPLEPVPVQQPADAPAVADPVPLAVEPAPVSDDDGRLPTGPPALAFALLVAAALSTTAAARQPR